MLNKRIEDFEKMIKNLEAVLKLEVNEYIRDSAIKRFELCFDLAWKAVKDYAKTQNVECYSPRECFREAFQLKLIDYSNKWMEMVDDRNLCTHIYNSKQAEEVYQSLGNYLTMFKGLHSKLRS